MLDIEYSVIMSDVIKSFDCIIMVRTGNFMHNPPWMHGWLELLFFMVPWKPFRAIEALLYPDQLALSEAIQ